MSMRNFNIIKITLHVLLLFIAISQSLRSAAQCRTDVNYGQNIVVNGDFSNGYTGWTFTPQTIPWSGDPPAVQADGYRIHGSPSLPGDILVGTNPNAQFNSGFQTFGDHTTGSGNFLMVDGVCKLGVTLFSETVTVAPSTNYYFSIWINSLKDNPTNPGKLNFAVGGVNIGNIVAPALGGGSPGGAWIKFEVVWNSGATSGNVAISIQNQNTASCSNEVDFAIDDIAFIPGCSYGSPGPQPDLGPDQSLCGKGGSITLDSNVPHLATTTVSWSDGTTGTGLSAPYTKVITAPGTYSVCVTDNGSCTKSDVIVITNTFSINIGGPYTLCASNSQVLDAGYTGIGITYLWSKNGTTLPYPNNGKTYTATSAGTYKVDVTVPGCGTQSSTTTITSTAPVTPVDAYYCATSAPAAGVTLQATGTNSATYTWYTTATGGTSFNVGSSYTITPAIPTGTTSTYTYYVQDNVAQTGTVGPTTEFATGTATDVYPGNAQTTGGMCSGGCTNQNGIYFNAVQAFKLNSVQIPFRVSNANTGTPMTITSVVLKVYTAAGVATTAVATSTNAPVIIPGVNSSTFALYTFTFSGFTIDPVALGTSNLLLKVETVNTNYELWRYQMENRTGLTSPFPYNSTITPNPASITSSYSGNSNVTTQYFGIYNWNISATTPCARTPVRAINNCPQPVTWTTFYLVPEGNSCKIVWGTANEINNKYFTVERSSDGINFETIETVTGAGTRDLASNYYYVDNAPLPGISYYRITQHDINGQFTSTEMKAYSANALTQVTTYPNPFVQSTTLLVTGADTMPYSYTIYSVNGQLVETGTGSFNQPKIIAEGIAKGMYMVTVSSTTDIITTKIVKQ